MARSIIEKDIDASMDNKLAIKYPTGDTFEMLKPVALELIQQMGITFDLHDFRFIISGHAGGMVWTKNIAYGVGSPPRHPDLGVPLPPQAQKFIRPATDE